MARERVVRSNGTSATHARRGVSVAELRQLIALMNGSDIEEITVEHPIGALRLTLRKPAPARAPLAPAVVAEFDASDLVDAPTEPVADDRLVDVRSPLVGIFRATMKPGGKLLATADATVRQGQIVGAIEALNVLNEVEASVAGRVTELVVHDGQPVEYGQPLMRIERARP